MQAKKLQLVVGKPKKARESKYSERDLGPDLFDDTDTGACKSSGKADRQSRYAESDPDDLDLRDSSVARLRDS